MLHWLFLCYMDLGFVMSSSELSVSNSTSFYFFLFIQQCFFFSFLFQRLLIYPSIYSPICIYLRVYFLLSNNHSIFIFRRVVYFLLIYYTCNFIVPNDFMLVQCKLIFSSLSWRRCRMNQWPLAALGELFRSIPISNYASLLKLDNVIILVVVEMCYGRAR